MIPGIVLAGIIAPLRVTIAGNLERAIELILQVNKAAAQVQKKVEDLDDQTTNMAAEYRGVLQQTDSLRLYNQQIELLVKGQREAIEELQGKIDNATSIGRDVTPLMLRMIDALDAFVDLDVPFLLKERKERIVKLRNLMGDPNVTDAERFRQILEAFQIENDYGRTIESYRGVLPGEAEERTVNFLRVGRIALLYATIDGEEIAAWNVNDKAFEKLGSEYRSAIQEGLRIARKQSAPDLFRIPVPAPTASKREVAP